MTNLLCALRMWWWRRRNYWYLWFDKVRLSRPLPKCGTIYIFPTPAGPGAVEINGRLLRYRDEYSIGATTDD